jgi:hypothetical protein
LFNLRHGYPRIHVLLQLTHRPDPEAYGDPRPPEKDEVSTIETHVQQYPQQRGGYCYHLIGLPQLPGWRVYAWNNRAFRAEYAVMNTGTDDRQKE